MANWFGEAIDQMEIAGTYNLIYNAVKKGYMDKARALWINDCIACGICSYVCPSGIPLAHIISLSRH